MKNVRTFQVLADYHQFYLMDAGAEPQIPEKITEQDMLRRLRTAPHMVVFHTESASQVPVEITFGLSLSTREVYGNIKPSSVLRSRQARLFSVVAPTMYPSARGFLWSQQTTTGAHIFQAQRSVASVISSCFGLLPPNPPLQGTRRQAARP